MNIPEPIIALLIVFVPLATTGIYIIFREQRAADAAAKKKEIDA